VKTQKQTRIRKAPLVLRLAFRSVLTILIAFFATGFIVTVLGITGPTGEDIILAATVGASLGLFLCLTYRAGIKRKAELGAAAHGYSGGSLLLLGTMKNESGHGGGSSGSGGEGGGWSGGDCGDGGGGGGD
jgi:uncharacterized membrane protein YgcG